LTSIHDLHALRLMPSPFSSVPQLAQLIDCIVNVVCHVSAVSPRVEWKQGVSMLPQERGVVVVLSGEGEKESREYDRTTLL
jgi:hypothetical protein